MFAFIFGVVLGLFTGFLIVGLMAMASDRDKNLEKWEWEQDNNRCWRCGGERSHDSMHI